MSLTCSDCGEQTTVVYPRPRAPRLTLVCPVCLTAARTPVEIRRPALRYMGSKFRMGWMAELLECIPHETYCAAFGGAAGDILARTHPAPVECYNDLDASLANLFRVLRDRRQARDLLRRLRWTEYGQPVQREAIQVLRRHDAGDPDLDPVDLAWAVYVRSWTGVMGVLQRCRQFGYSRVRDRSYNPKSMRGAIAYLPVIMDRLRHLQVFCEDWRVFCRRFERASGVLLYLDPPYPRETRNQPTWRRDDYNVDLDDQPCLPGTGRRDLHAEISEWAAAAECPLAISTYAGEWEQALLENDGWRAHRREVKCGAGQCGRATRTEVVLLNRQAAELMSEEDRERWLS